MVNIKHLHIQAALIGLNKLHAHRGIHTICNNNKAEVMDFIRSGGNWRGKEKVEIIRILYSCIIFSKN